MLIKFCILSAYMCIKSNDLFVFTIYNPNVICYTNQDILKKQAKPFA